MLCRLMKTSASRIIHQPEQAQCWLLGAEKDVAQPNCFPEIHYSNAKDWRA